MRRCLPKPRLRRFLAWPGPLWFWVLACLLFIFSVTGRAQTATSASSTQVWVAEHSWSDPVSPDSDETWDDRYSEWVNTDVDEHIFKNPQSPLYGIPTDCAEAVNDLRALFCFENHLPFIVHTSAGGFVSNAVNVGGSTPLQKFRSFIQTLNTEVNTSTLSRDTYPVSIDRNNLKPGDILLYYENSNKVTKHSHTVHAVDDFGIIQFLSSTEPKTVRNLSVEEGIDRAPFTDGQDGLRAWHHYSCNTTSSESSQAALNCDPHTHTFSSLAVEPGSKQDAEKNPSNFPLGYVDQYAMVDPDRPEDWGDAVSSALQIVGEVPEEKLTRLANNVCDSLHLREENVTKGLDYMKKTSNRCANDYEWDEYSTPNEDKKIWLQFKIIDKFIAHYCDDPISCQKMKKLRDDNFSTCTLFWDTEQETDLNTIRKKYKNRLVSADPNDSWAQRWGIDPNDPTDSRAGRDMDDPDGLIWKPYIDKPVSFSGCTTAQDLKDGALGALQQRAQ